MLYPFPGVIRTVLCLVIFFVSAVTLGEEPAKPLAVLDGRLLPEASGIAVSSRTPSVLWVLNDSGNDANLIAFDTDLDTYRTVSIQGVRNRDWEDLESFVFAGEPWLLIADVGDNDARREEVFLHLLPEPREDADKARIVVTLAVRYSQGAADVESVAVDPRRRAIYLLTKRESPPVLHEVPLPALDVSGRYAVEAQVMGAVESIPLPSDEELSRYPRFGRFRHQPTAMSLSPDGSLIAVMTYRGAYLAELPATQTWLEALNNNLCAVSTPALRQGETIVLGADTQLYLTSEGAGAPLYRIPGRCADDAHEP